jgi:membrane protein YqaA with SNARE-associated domain
MRLFENLYQAVIRFSRSRHAPWYLSGLSFLESFILPFPPPDVMLAPMSLTTPGKAMYFASLTLVSSVVGGIAGYLIGAFLFDQVRPLLFEWGYQSAVDTVTRWFDQWGFWAVVIAGFSPVPYKIFTITAGALGLSFLPFVMASLIGRGARFFLVAWSLAKFGPAIESRLIANIETVGWGIVAFLVVIIVIYYT